MQEIDAEQIATRLEEIAGSLSLPEDSRIRQAALVLRQVAEQVRVGNPEKDSSKIQQFSLALHDGLLAIEAFDVLTRAPATQNAERRLRSALSGAFVVPAPTEGDDQERDLLWELFVAARARTAGFEPVLGAQDKPDVAIPSLCLGAEAKRLRSHKQISARVGRGVEQIKRNVENGHIQGGFICLDLSFALGQHAQLGHWQIQKDSDKGLIREQLMAGLVQLAEGIRHFINACEGARQGKAKDAG